MGPLTVRVVCPECGDSHDVLLKDGHLARAELGRSAPSLSRSPRLERLLQLAQSVLR